MTDVREGMKRLLAAFFDTHRIGVGLSEPGRADVLRMWMQALKGLTPEQIRIAVERFNAECKEFPTIARLRSYAPGGAALDDEQRAEVAWSTVLKAIRSIGAYDDVDFADRLVTVAIRGLGGWVVLCNSATDELVWKKKEFVSLYVAAARSGVGDATPLKGLYSQTDGGLRPAKLIGSSLPEHGIATRLEYREPRSAAGLAGTAKFLEHVTLTEDEDGDSAGPRIN